MSQPTPPPPFQTPPPPFLIHPCTPPTISPRLANKGPKFAKPAPDPFPLLFCPQGLYPEIITVCHSETSVHRRMHRRLMNWRVHNCSKHCNANAVNEGGCPVCVALEIHGDCQCPSCNIQMTCTPMQDYYGPQWLIGSVKVLFMHDTSPVFHPRGQPYFTGDVHQTLTRTEKIPGTKPLAFERRKQIVPLFSSDCVGIRCLFLCA